jgi:D-glycero-beta-D-manno-heptose-7-phosphate kinase
VKLPSEKAVQALRVLVAGDVMLDRYWYGAVDRISPEAPVPVVRVQRDEERLGAAANVALNVRALGAQATLAAVLGGDPEGQTLRRMLQAQGIQDACTPQDELRTTVKLRVIGRQQQLIRLDFEATPAADVLDRFTARVVSEIAQHNLVLVSDYAKGALRDVSALIAAARTQRKPVFVDPKGRDWQRYRGATVATPNVAELQAVVGDWADEATLQRKAQALREDCQWEALLLTRGADGMTLFSESGDHTVPARAREVFDVTGAGDTVIAVLAVLRAAGSSWLDAFEGANEAAGRVVGRLGTAAVTWAQLQG